MEEHKQTSAPAREAWLDILLIWAAVSSVFWVPWALGYFPFDGVRGEQLMQWIPFRSFSRHCYGQGTFPLWNRYIFCGTPFWGYSHTMSAYPLMIASLPFSILSGTCLFMTAHALILVAGAYRLLMLFDFGRALRATGALVLAAGAYGMSAMVREFYLNLAVASWLPLLVLGGIWLIEKRDLRSFLGLAATMAMMLATGDIEGSFHNMAGAVIFWACLRPGHKAFLRPAQLAAVALAGAAAIVLVSAMSLPLAEFMPHNVRSGGVAYNIFTESSNLIDKQRTTDPSPLLGFGFIFAMSSPFKWYMLFFAGFHLAARKNKGSWAIAAAVLAGLAYAFHFPAPLDHPLHRLPLLNVFIKRSQAFGPIVFLLEFLCLLGMADFIKASAETPKRAAMIALSAVGCAGAAAAAVLLGDPGRYLQVLGYPIALALGLLLPARANPARAAAVFAVSLALLLTGGGLLSSMEFRDAGYFRSHPFEKAARKMDPESRYLSSASLIEPVPPLYTQQGMVERRPQLWGWNRVPPRRLMELIRLIDPGLVSFENGRLSNMDFVFRHPDGSLLRAERTDLLETMSVRYVLNRGIPLKRVSPRYLVWLVPLRDRLGRTSPEDWRDLKVTDEPLKLVLVPGGEERLVIAMTSGEGAAPAEVLVKVNVEGRERARKVLVRPGSAPSANPELFGLDLAEYKDKPVEVVIELADPSDPKAGPVYLRAPMVIDREETYALLYQDKYLDLYDNDRALPLFYLVRGARLFESKADILAALRDARSEELGRVAFLSGDEGAEAAGDLPAQGHDAGSAGDTLDKVSEAPGRRVYELDSRAEGILVESESLFPGWEARVGGEESRLFHVHWAFRGVRAPAGEARVVIEYRPRGFRLGLWTTLASALFLASVLGARFFRRARRSAS